MPLHYLEIVTAAVDETCSAYAAALHLDFGPPVVALGGARTAPMPHGGRVGVRPPLHAKEAPVVRPYWRVDDIHAALAAIVEAGGVVALPPMPLPGEGQCAIYLQGGIDHGLWQV